VEYLLESKQQGFAILFVVHLLATDEEADSSQLHSGYGLFHDSFARIQCQARTLGRVLIVQALKKKKNHVLAKMTPPQV